MNKTKNTSIRVENKFQVEKENHVVVMEFDMEPEGIIIQLRTSDLPSFHHATILEQYKKVSIELFLKHFGPLKRWTSETRSLFYYLGRFIDRKVDAAIMEVNRPGPLRRSVNATFVTFNEFSSWEK